MFKKAIALAVAIIAALSAQTSQSEARGFRFCVGCAVAGAVLGGHLYAGKADNSIMERQNEAIRRYHIKRRRALQYQRHEAEIEYRKAAAHRAAIAKAKARHAAAAKAKAKAKAEAAARIAKAKAAAKDAALSGDDSTAADAQAEQTAKAQKLVQQLSSNSQGTAPVAKVSAKPSERPVVKSASDKGEASRASSDCKRFIPSAGITVTVPCTE
ncbi:MAG: hypothetical protein AB7O43_04060 [Hyphomicrobiaceae bacterium]